jgi:hypothetical protein
MDIRDNCGLMSRFRVQHGVRIARRARGSFVQQQHLIRDLLALVAATPDIGQRSREQGLALRVVREESITDRIMRMEQDDILQAAALVERRDVMGALSFVFGTAKQRLVLAETNACILLVD